jgi:hypothetical protein
MFMNSASDDIRKVYIYCVLSAREWRGQGEGGGWGRGACVNNSVVTEVLA